MLNYHHMEGERFRGREIMFPAGLRPRMLFLSPVFMETLYRQSASLCLIMKSDCYGVPGGC